MPSAETIAFVLAVFFAAGFVKGVVGMGLPSTTLALLTATVGLKSAMALILVPTVATNLVQAVTGGHFRALVMRFWPLFATSVVGVWFGSSVLARADGVKLAAGLGLLLIVYALCNLASFRLPSPGRAEGWLTPVVGLATGFIKGITGSFIFPAVFYMEALGLRRDELVQAMGMAFTVGVVALAAGLFSNHLLTPQLALLSLLGTVPALLGMRAGLLVRRRLDEERFRRVFFVALLLLGLYLALRPFWG
ncbi:MAG: sulfite exporter TauE/SafE family protein [Hyphomicrobiales bacterium]